MNDATWEADSSRFNCGYRNLALSLFPWFSFSRVHEVDDYGSWTKASGEGEQTLVHSTHMKTTKL